MMTHLMTVQDCAGVWGGNATLKDYYIDSDGDGLGSGDSLKKCDGLFSLRKMMHFRT